MKELSLHILDIVQNSISAGATVIKITIIEDIAEDKFIISVDDNGHGIDEKLIEKVKDPFFTSRKTRRVGLGIPFLMSAAQRCNGNLNIQSSPGVGTKITAEFSYSHIDRAPLGNIWDAIKNLVVCSEGIEYIYTHICNGIIFEFNTMNVKNILGEVPITTPEVVEWIGEYLKENIKNLYGGVGIENNTGIGGNKKKDS